MIVDGLWKRSVRLGSSGYLTDSMGMHAAQAQQGAVCVSSVFDTLLILNINF